MIANLMTLSRLVLVVPISFFVYKDYVVTSFVLLIVALITDFLDGFIARKLNQETTLGKSLDPIVDKVLHLTLLLIFIEKGYISSIAPLIIVIRDVIVTGLRGVSFYYKGDISSKYHGKLKAILQDISLFVILIFKKSLISDVMIWSVAALTFYSGIRYSLSILKVINQRRKNVRNDIN
ncbi:MAG TPA: CDP-diacylglycerol--glycerol-3-phosphate 3-phosphatidyltransferase [Fusobacteria bacterium]|nr:CDP-diacylglycerol--glycerol-3-phosphate 3-phosphatidyltransferase [Fusobacteriota bacterium]|tara:strand:+ start:8456 stop:8992 length:537 start_codon:yes stop_codon:yes gene_type:complete